MVDQAQTSSFQTVGIVGVGLIGGSIGIALKQQQLAQQVLGVGRSLTNLEIAKSNGLIDVITDLEQMAKVADLMIVCVPVAQTRTVLQGIFPHLKKDAIIIDVGSTKMDVIQVAKEVLGERIHQFIACHPIAGGARHGASAARIDLFHNKQVMMCPLFENLVSDVDRIEQLWNDLGARVYKMSALEHDHIFAAVSHLPHLLSYALMLQVANAPDADKKFVHAGAGFRDFTRIAASSPEMWTDISFANRDALLKELDGYLLIVEQMKKSIQNGDAELLQKMFQIASDSRKDWQG